MTQDPLPPLTAESITAGYAESLAALVWRASEAILAIGDDARAARLKPDRSPITAADEAADAVLAEGLARILPGLPVISEETVESAPAPGTSLALVDPLDGTKEFLAGRDEYTVNLAIVAEGMPIAGFIAIPPLGLVYRGVVGYGTERLRFAPGADRPSERSRISCRRWPAEGPVAAVSRSHPDSATGAFIDRLPRASRLACGSALKFCRLAEGAVDVYPRLSRTSEWDIAAGHAIVTAAGGLVAAPDGTALSFGHAERDYKVAGFIAWGDPEAARRVTAPVGS